MGDSTTQLVASYHIEIPEERIPRTILAVPNQRIGESEPWCDVYFIKSLWYRVLGVQVNVTMTRGCIFRWVAGPGGADVTTVP